MTFWILVAAIVIVHLHLEYRVWIRREEDIFAKYRTGSFPPLAAARGAYLAKAAPMFQRMENKILSGSAFFPIS